MPKFLNTPEDCQWLRDGHLKGVPLSRPFLSFVIYGDETAPDRVDLYDSADPLYSDAYRLVRFVSAPGYCEIDEVPAKASHWDVSLSEDR